MKTNLVFLFIVILFRDAVGENLIHMYFDYFEDIYFHTNSSGISENCSKIFKDGIFSDDILYDASAKLPSGIYQGDYFDLGNFDECYNYVKNTSEGTPVFGKYCLGQMNTEMIHIDVSGKIENISLHSGFCLNSYCSLDDFSKIFYLHNFTEDKCHSRQTESSIFRENVITIVIIGTSTAVVLLSTLYDMVLSYKGIETKRQPMVIFSALENTKKHFATSNSSNQILCIHGIKTISIFWIIFFHEHAIWQNAPLSNQYDLPKYDEVKNAYISHAPLAVDTFLTIAGMLTTLSMLKKKNINIFICIMHRYLRLTPVLAIAVLMHSTILRYFGNGPCWNIFESILIQPCRNNWWMTLLYVQNYLSPMNYCVPQSWYLAVDMHCFIFGTIILILLRNSIKKMVFVTASLILTGIAVTYFICYTYGLPVSNYTNGWDKSDNYIKTYYVPTHTRFPPYMIGMLCGLFMKSIQSSEVGKYHLTHVCIMINYSLGERIQLFFVA
nr:nose resistant to fluoxetine protein 6-like isoform X1 [Leptinotarsa decemlineata]